MTLTNPANFLGAGVTSMALSASEAAVAPMIVTGTAMKAVSQGGSITARGPQLCVGPFCIQGPQVTVTGRKD